MTFALIMLLSAAATEEDPIALGRGYTELHPAKVKFGLSGGLGVGPHPTYYESGWWGTAELAGLMELTFSKISFRFALSLRPGATADDVLIFTFAVTAGFELRLHPTPHFSLGFGLDGGLGVLHNPYLLVAPTVTPGSVKFGQRLQHEFGVTFALVLQLFNLPSGYCLLRYTRFF